MPLNVFNRTRQKGWLEYQPLFAGIMDKALKMLGRPADTAVSVIFVSPRRIRQINRDYRHLDRPTDVISFALADDAETDRDDFVPQELGDIFINVQAVADQAVEYGHSQRREACFLFTHGLLHLCGFDHQTKTQESRMIAWQKKILDDIVRPDDA